MYRFTFGYVHFLHRPTPTNKKAEGFPNSSAPNQIINIFDNHEKRIFTFTLTGFVSMGGNQPPMPLSSCKTPAFTQAVRVISCQTRLVHQSMDRLCWQTRGGRALLPR